jgi:predicted nucleic acid-binding protein
LTAAILIEAARGSDAYHTSFWDAQISATAKRQLTPWVVSEGFSHGTRIEGVEFLNPFAANLPGEEP